MKPIDENYLIVSFHDLAPHSRPACEQFLGMMREVGIERVTLLVVPMWYEQSTIDQHPDFVDWLLELQAQGHEIQLHGWSHRVKSVDGGLWAQIAGNVYTAREGEFYQLNYQDALSRLRAGCELFQTLGLHVQGFTAPAWLLSGPARQALIDLGFEYTTYLQHVEWLPAQERFYAPTLVYSSRSAWRGAASRVWLPCWQRLNASAEYLRLAIHPVDMQFSGIRQSFLHLARLTRMTREPITYRQMFMDQQLRTNSISNETQPTA